MAFLKALVMYGATFALPFIVFIGACVYVYMCICVYVYMCICMLRVPVYICLRICVHLSEPGITVDLCIYVH